MTEYRASFDADIPGPDVAEKELASRFVRHLGLLMVERVRLRDVQVFAEPHKGSRGGPADRAAPRPERGRLVELSHEIEAGMTTYPGLPGPEIAPYRSHADSRGHYAPGIEFAIDRISMVGNTGTYLDSPYHRYPDGPDLAGVPLTAIADLPAVVVRPTGGAERSIGPVALAPYDLAGAAVLLLHTGWDRHWRTETYGQGGPYLTEAAARRLAAGIPVLEHLTGLDLLPVTGARLHAAPPRVRAVGSFPVRAYAVVPDSA